MSADRIVPANGILDNGAEDSAHVGVQHESFGKPRDMLRLECIRHVVSFRRTLEVVKNSANIRSALQIRNAQGRSALQHMGPGSTSVNGLLPENGSFVHVHLSLKIFGSLLVDEL